MKKKNVKRVVFIAISTLAVLYLLFGVYKIKKWNADKWILTYVEKELSGSEDIDSGAVRHVVFTFVDHYEPGYKEEEAFENHTKWMALYKKAIEGHVDSYGNSIKYTWYYPYDQRIDKVLVSLTKAVHDGLGEVEMHWHHPKSDNEKFPRELKEAIAWYNQYGALLVCGNRVETRFSFIHGNWALDNSLNGRLCGVSREIEYLFDQGAYADLTFSTIGTDAQPTERINAIYYVNEDEGSKSYNDGPLVEKDKVVDNKMMMIQGPMSINFLKGFSLEYGALETYARPDKNRIERWIDADIHVKGRPEWTFVKLYSHGIQSEDIMRAYFGKLLGDIEQYAKEEKLRLHYMTSRELYNVIKAAEKGMEGDPEQYRDFVVPKPCNKYFTTETPVHIAGFENGKVVVE
jgi:hypothetical protein